MAGVRRTKSGTGEEHENWRFWYQDYTGKRRWGTGVKSKTKTLAMARKLEEEHREIRLGLRPRPNESSVRKALDVVNEYLAWGNAYGGRGGRAWGKHHADNRKLHLNWWLTQLDLKKLSDLHGSLSRVEERLRALRDSGKAPRTVAGYAESIAAFCDWCVKRDFLNEDPLRRLGKLDNSPLTTRRALTEAEVSSLLSVAPPNRGLVYLVALCTGLRAGELKALKVGDLDKARGGLILRAQWTKNRKDGFQPLTESVARLLAELCEGRAITDRLLRVPRNAGRMLDVDYARAGIAKHQADGKVDFHSLRVTYATMVVDAGASVKEAQSLMRHSVPSLTMNVYARTRDSRLHELAEKVGKGVGDEKFCAIGVQRHQLPTSSNRDNPRRIKAKMDLEGGRGAGIRTRV